MQKNKNNTDNNFSEIENNTEADLSQMDNHWAQMKNTLAKTAPKNATPKKWLWASVPIIAAVGLVLFFATKKPNDNTAAIEKNTITAEIKNDLPNTEITQNNIDTTQKNKITNAKKQIRNAKFSMSETEFASNKNSYTSSTKTQTDDVSLSTKNKPIENKNTNEQIVTDTVKVDMSLAEIENIKILNDFIAKIQKKGELFTINNTRDTLVEAAEGTVFFIPKNSFNTTESVVFEVKEYYKYSDMIANGLKTMADDKQLISGGMLSLTATVNGKEIAMNPTKEIRVFIPNLTPKDSMKIFVGKEQKQKDVAENNVIKNNNVNWQLTDMSIAQPTTTMYLRAIDLREDNVTEKTKIFTNKRVGLFRRSRKSEINKEELIAMLKKKYGSYYDIIKVRNERKRNLFLQIRDLTGDWILGDHDSRGIGDTLEFEVNNFRLFNLDIIDTVYRQNKSFGGNLVYANAPQFSQKALKMIDNKYSIGINKLGWINCDRFYDFYGAKQDIYVNVNDNARNYITYLIFDNYKSIMNGYWLNKEYKFDNVPLGIPAKVLSIGVKDGQTIFAMKSIITSKEKISDLQFENVSSLEFKDSLKTFDKPKETLNQTP
jgi:hypothetical protein